MWECGNVRMWGCENVGMWKIRKCACPTEALAKDGEVADQKSKN